MVNPKTCLGPTERIHLQADASRQAELTMDSPCPSLPGPNPTPDPPLPPDPSPFPGPPITIGQFTACSYLPLKGWSGSIPYYAHRPSTALLSSSLRAG